MTAGLQALPKPVMAVHRAVQILRFLGESAEPAGVHEVARALGIVPSTCLHILRTLAHDGMVSVDGRNKRYRLGPMLLRLARDMAGTSGFILAIQPLLDQISADHDVTTAAVSLESDERLIVVAKSQVPTDLSINIAVGGRFPSLISAIGLSLAASADLPPERLERQFNELTWQNPPSFADWSEKVALARADGYAIDVGYYLQGVTVLATPVFDIEGHASRFIVALGFSRQLQGASGSQLAEVMKQTAASVSNIYPADVAHPHHARSQVLG